MVAATDGQTLEPDPAIRSQIPDPAGAATSSTPTNQQAGTVSRRHRSTAGARFQRQRGRDSSATARARLRWRRHHPEGLSAQDPHGVGRAPCLCPRGVVAGGPFRDRLGPLRLSRLRRRQAQVVRLLAGGMPQPHDVHRVHAQCFETFVRCHVHAFQALGGIARHLVYDNLATAVAEHQGNLVRFHPRFLAFARECGFLPRACHVASPWEKGKVERAGIGYLRQNFWPLRAITGLADANRQVKQWLDEVANQRLHRETRERPDQRFLAGSLLPVPALLPDYRDTADALVHKDLRLQFDGNRYCLPARYAGCRMTLKADSHSLTIYDQHREVVTYPRCWRRGQTLAAERFEKELLDQRPAAHLSRTQQRLVTQLGARAAEYLRNLAQSDRALPRQIAELNELVRNYGPEAVAQAIDKAAAARAFGTDYIANILRQQSSPRPVEPPVRLK